MLIVKVFISRKYNYSTAICMELNNKKDAEQIELRSESTKTNKINMK